MKPIATVLSFVALLSSAFALARDSPEPPAWEVKANELVTPLLKKELRNVVLGVIDAGGMRHYLTFGDKPDGLEKLDENTIFEIGSVTKVFTSLLLADAVVRGDVKLDDPVQKYLPGTIEVPKRGEELITLEELATHTSGLPRLASNFMKAEGFSMSNPYAKYDEKLLAEGVKKARIKRGKPRVSYSNLGVGLLGFTLTRRSGKTYDNLLQERVSGPLGMASSAVVVKPENQSRVLQGYDSFNRPGGPWDFQDTTAGAGAIRSTAADMLTFLECESGRRASPLKEPMDLTQKPRREVDSTMSIGLGWFTYETGVNKRRVWWHNGATGCYCSFAAFCRDPGVGLVILSNRSNPGATDRIGRELIGLLAETR